MTGFSYQQTGRHLIGVYRAPRAGLEAWLFAIRASYFPST